MVRSECDTLKRSKYEGSVVDLIIDQVQPGVKFLVVHLDLTPILDLKLLTHSKCHLEAG